MENNKQQANKTNDSQQAIAQPINLNDYAGDEKDDQLAQDQANRYEDDLDRGSEKRKDQAKGNTDDAG